MTRRQSPRWAREQVWAEARARQRAGGAPRRALGPNLAVLCQDIGRDQDIDLDDLLVVAGVLLDRGDLQGLIRDALRGPARAR